MHASTESKRVSRISIPSVFRDSLPLHNKALRRWLTLGSLACVAVAITIWGTIIAARREAIALDRFALSEIRQDSVLRVFAQSRNFSSGLLSTREASGQGRGLISPFIREKPDRASDLLATLDEAQDTALDLTWVAHLEQRVMKAGTSQPLMVVFRHRDPQTIQEPLKVLVSINYDPAEFALSPQQLSKEVVVAPGQKIGSTSWILRPLRSGNHSLAIEAMGDVQALGVNVRTILGFPPSVAHVTAIFAGVLSFLLNIPWLFDLWRKIQERTPRRARAQTSGNPKRRRR